jgi:hypothetical protein
MMKKTLLTIPGVALLVILAACSSSDPVSIEGDEILLTAGFLTTDTNTGKFSAIILAIVQDPQTGVRRDGVRVIFRITSGAGILSDLEVDTNDDGEAYSQIDADGPVTVEVSSGPVSATIDLSAEGGSTSTNQQPDADIEVTTAAPTVNIAVTFDVSGSDDPDGSVEEWEIITFGDDNNDPDPAEAGPFDFGDRTDTTHTYATADSYTVKVQVTDDEGGVDTAEVTVVVSN